MWNWSSYIRSAFGVPPYTSSFLSPCSWQSLNMYCQGRRSRKPRKKMLWRPICTDGALPIVHCCASHEHLEASLGEHVHSDRSKPCTRRFSVVFLWLFRTHPNRQRQNPAFIL